MLPYAHGVESTHLVDMVLPLKKNKQVVPSVQGTTSAGLGSPAARLLGRLTYINIKRLFEKNKYT